MHCPVHISVYIEKVFQLFPLQIGNCRQLFCRTSAPVKAKEAISNINLTKIEIKRFRY